MALSQVGPSQLTANRFSQKNTDNAVLAERVDIYVISSQKAQPPSLIPRGINALGNETSPHQAMQVLHALPKDAFNTISEQAQQLPTRTQVIINHVAREQEYQEHTKQLAIRQENLEQQLQRTSLLEEESASLTKDITTREDQLEKAGESNKEIGEKIKIKQNELEKSAHTLQDQCTKEENLQKDELRLKEAIESKQQEDAETQARANEAKKKLEELQNAGGICALF